jgi:hypothetical protein
MERNDKFLTKDRMRFTRNSTSATLAYVSILFNVFYYVYIYNFDVGNYFYNATTGYSVVYNLLFLLFAFLASEGIKNYNNKFALVLIGLGALQIVRIFYIPLNALNATIVIGGEAVQVMTVGQFALSAVFLTLSSIAAIAGGIIGFVKTGMLRSHEKRLAKAAKNN